METKQELLKLVVEDLINKIKNCHKNSKNILEIIKNWAKIDGAFYFISQCLPQKLSDPTDQILYYANLPPKEFSKVLSDCIQNKDFIEAMKEVIEEQND